MDITLGLGRSSGGHRLDQHHTGLSQIEVVFQFKYHSWFGKISGGHRLDQHHTGLKQVRELQ